MVSLVEWLKQQTLPVQVTHMLHGLVDRPCTACGKPTSKIWSGHWGEYRTGLFLACNPQCAQAHTRTRFGLDSSSINP